MVSFGPACWFWMGYINDDGYGQIGADGGYPILKAHRVSWQINYGPIPRGVFVCHKCDNRPCVNPAHLFLGTAKDNIHDCVSKGRFPCGTKMHQSKLTPDTVLQIRERRAAGESFTEMAERFGVSRNAVHQVTSGRSWRSVK